MWLQDGQIAESGTKDELCAQNGLFARMWQEYQASVQVEGRKGGEGMIEKIQHATASSPEGAKGLVKGVLACAFQNMAFMLPTGLLYLLVKDLLAGSTSGRSTFYLLGCALPALH